MRKSTLACAAVAAGALALPASASAADAIYGITDGNRLIRVHSDSPGSVQSSLPLQGLNAGEQVLGLDVRPSDDRLYAVTTGNRALAVNPITGATRPAFGPFDPALSGASFGVDFNPVANALRIVSDTEQNLRVNAANATTADTALAYAAGDAGAGSNPSVGAAAYTNATPDATSTTLLGVDSARDTLVRIDPPNAGTLATVGALNQNIDEPVGFDVAPGGQAYVAAKRAGQTATELFRVDVNTGAATPAAASTAIAIPQGAGALRGIAVAGGVPDDKTPPEMSVAFSSTILESNTNPLKPSISCDETCTVTVRATVQGRNAGSGSETIVGAGRETVEIPLNTTARNRIARRGTELIRLFITATDAAGNRVTQNERRSRTQTIGARLGR